MIYKFKNILDMEVIQSADVMFIFGDKPVFNNIVADNCREKCENIQDDMELELLSEFNVEFSKRASLNKVNIEQFMEVCHMPSLAGIWYCRVQLKELKDKEIDWLKKYIKKPSDNAMLVVEATEYKYYRNWLKNKSIEYSKKVHLIQLSFPSRKELIQIVKNKFKNRRTVVDEEAVKIFIQRMGGRYDLYDEVIRELTPYGDELDHKVENWNTEIMKGNMRGIQHYSIDMLLYEMLKGSSSGKVSGRVKIVKLLKYLEDEYGSDVLVSKLRKEVDGLIQVRLWINNGNIPVGIKFPIEEVKNKLDKDMSTAVFKRKVQMASRVSLRDLVFIRTTLDTMWYNPERCLYIIAVRHTLTKENIDRVIYG